MSDRISLKTTLSSTQRDALDQLCVQLGVSPTRGKGYVIGELIERTSVENGDPYVTPFPSSDFMQTFRNQYADSVRIGSNLNQLVHLLQIENIRLENHEIDSLVVDVEFLLSILKELNILVKAQRDSIKEIARRYP